MKFIDFKGSNTNYKTEIRAGLLIFFSCCYLLTVNPNIMVNAGMPVSGTFLATALGSAIACFISFLLSDYPLAMIPGMGLNSLFVYEIVIKCNVSYKAALAIVFISAIIFSILAITPWRDQIVNIFPDTLKIAIVISIGCFIGYVGLQNCGIMRITSSGILFNLFNPITLMVILGLAITLILTYKKINASLFIGLISTLVIGLILLFIFGENSLLPHLTTNIYSFNFDFSLFGCFIEGFSELSQIPPLKLILILFSILIIWLFDAVGVLISVAHSSGHVEENGDLKDIKNTMVSNGFSSMIGAFLGTSNITPAVESMAGVTEGGRTRWTTLVVGICFLFSIIFAPLLTSLFTTAVTSPILIVVSLIMIYAITQIDYKDHVELIPVFVTIAGVITELSLFTGIFYGLITYLIVEFVRGNIKKNKGLILPVIILIILTIFSM